MGFLFLLIFELVLVPYRGHALELQPGDILIGGASCWTCTLIEKEEGSPYVHSGVILKSDSGSGWAVAETLDRVTISSLNIFKSRSKPSIPIQVLRARRWLSLTDTAKNSIDLALKYRLRSLLGAPFDYLFLWDNWDLVRNQQKYYCSELVYKLLQPMLWPQVEPGVWRGPVKRMHFQVNRPAWEDYFRGQRGVIPDGEIGLSPKDFLEDTSLQKLGTL